MDAKREFSVLFVCYGNACRSPTAEGVMRQRAARAGLAQVLRIDSAGTHDDHLGEAPDLRSQQVAGQRGYDLSAHIARRVNRDDFEYFDLVLAADRRNLADLRALCPMPLQHKLALILDVLPEGEMREVPDPYFGGLQGFNHVLDLLEVACDGWIERIGHGQTA